MIDWRLAKEAFEKERDIPYRIPLSPQEEDHCCAGKHTRLKAHLEALGVPVRSRICWFKWSDIALPQTLQEIPHDNNSSHLYLEIQRDGHWIPLDASWDLGLASRLPVSVWSEPFVGTAIGVPAYKTLSPEESASFMNGLTTAESEEDLRKNSVFFEALNAYLEEVRMSCGYQHRILP